MTSPQHLRHFYMHTHLHSVLTSAASATFFRDSSVVLAELLCEANQTATTLVGSDMARSPITRSTENTSLPQAYTSFGYEQPPEPTLKLTGFTGQPRSVSAHLYLMGSGRRAYNTALMRFCSPDYLSPFSKGGINAYVYCNNDPTNYSDQSGRVRTPHLGTAHASAPLKQIAPRSKAMHKTRPTTNHVEFELVEELISKQHDSDATILEKAGSGAVTDMQLTNDQINSAFQPYTPKTGPQLFINKKHHPNITTTEIDALRHHNQNTSEAISNNILNHWLTARTLSLRTVTFLTDEGIPLKEAVKIDGRLKNRLQAIRKNLRPR